MNANPTSLTPWRQLPAILLLVLGWLFAGQAHALIGGSISCSVSGTPTFGYTFEPGAEMKIPFSGNCQAIRVFPRGAALNHELYLTSGSGVQLQLLDPVYNMYPTPLPLGNFGGTCFNPYCGYMPPGAGFSYTFYVVGRAPTSPGVREVTLRLGYTAIGYPAYAEWMHQVNFRFTVVDTSCTVRSPSSVDLSFGSISSANLNNQKQSTSVLVNCPTAKSANVYLVPTQEVVNAGSGLARTSLTGLNMQALWTDTSSPVAFGTPRFMQLRAGSNALNLTFKPQLASSQAPSGAFQSQYTLVINYL
ncbi:fimbrial protein [Pseudomonas sp. LJDD11]|uniref:fimbrial protein n=1 Tax=unclassified Pseudomonas TaxID=196821 RepID=UPI002097907C|nr:MULTISPECIES: fimbrial protein [unclassified Pseudomonas]MCO8162958.1 fimbrial protein [Pseudomonas sp. 21LCFQ010]MCQ9424518.1 fimbrial protein [Pseudomonas sp. LJDD11]